MRREFSVASPGSVPRLAKGPGCTTRQCQRVVRYPPKQHHTHVSLPCCGADVPMPGEPDESRSPGDPRRRRATHTPQPRRGTSTRHSPKAPATLHSPRQGTSHTAQPSPRHQHISQPSPRHQPRPTALRHQHTVQPSPRHQHTAQPSPRPRLTWEAQPGRPRAQRAVHLARGPRCRPAVTLPPL